jgi:hypothetical protein
MCRLKCGVRSQETKCYCHNVGLIPGSGGPDIKKCIACYFSTTVPILSVMQPIRS